jgi:hypothetical protein
MKTMQKILMAGGLIGSACGLGCNETTHKDVTAARDKVAAEQRKLDDAKRDEVRTVQKPVVEQPTTNEAERGHDRVVKQAERVQDAKREEVKTEQDLATEQARDQFLIDCKASIDVANRAIEKLQTKKNATTEDQKADLDRHITDMKAKRDALQAEINNIRTADKTRWSDFKAAAQRAMDELNVESGKVS